jgi:hypothetical protein
MWDWRFSLQGQAVQVLGDWLTLWFSSEFLWYKGQFLWGAGAESQWIARCGICENLIGDSNAKLWQCNCQEHHVPQIMTLINTVGHFLMGRLNHIDHMKDRRWHWHVLEVQSLRGADCDIDTDHCLVVATVRERPSKWIRTATDLVRKI